MSIFRSRPPYELNPSRDGRRVTASVSRFWQRGKDIGEALDTKIEGYSPDYLLGQTALLQVIETSRVNHTSTSQSFEVLIPMEGAKVFEAADLFIRRTLDRPTSDQDHAVAEIAVPHDITTEQTQLAE